MGSISAIVTRSSSAGGATRLTIPHSRAWPALMLWPVSRHSAARPGPMSRGSNAASITEGTPTRISGSPMRASVAAVRISQAIASSNPPPRQCPFIMQTVGNGESWTAWIASCSIAMNALASRAVRSRRNWSCMPAVVTCPLPVSAAARTRGSSRSSSKAALIPRTISGTMRLSGGRSRVTQAQPPRCSTRTNAKSAITQVPLISRSPRRARRLRLLGPISARSGRTISRSPRRARRLRLLGPVSARSGRTISRSPRRARRLRLLGPVSARSGRTISRSPRRARRLRLLGPVSARSIRTISSSPHRARRLRLLGPVSARTSIPLHGGVDGLRPQVEPTRQVHRLGETEPAQIVGHRRAPDPVVAVDDDVLLGVQLIGAELDLLDWNVRGVLEAAEPGLPLVAHVEQDDGPLLLEPRPELVGTDLPWHHSTSVGLTISSSSVHRGRPLVGQEDGGLRRHLDLDMVSRPEAPPVQRGGDHLHPQGAAADVDLVELPRPFEDLR